MCFLSYEIELFESDCLNKKCPLDVSAPLWSWFQANILIIEPFWSTHASESRRPSLLTTEFALMLIKRTSQLECTYVRVLPDPQHAHTCN